jgi:hypothetical protein
MHIGMVSEINKYGVEVMVSVWPTVATERFAIECRRQGQRAGGRG